MLLSGSLLFVLAISACLAVAVIVIVRYLPAGQRERQASVPGPRGEQAAPAPAVHQAEIVRGRSGRHVSEIYAELQLELAELDAVFPLQVQRAMRDKQRRPHLVRSVKAAEAAADVELQSQVADAAAFVALHRGLPASPAAATS